MNALNMYQIQQMQYQYLLRYDGVIFCSTNRIARENIKKQITTKLLLINLISLFCCPLLGKKNG